MFKRVYFLFIFIATSLNQFQLFAQDSPIRVLFFGDSITAGYGLEPSQAYPSLLQDKMDSLNYSVKMINAGNSGETSAGGLRRVGWMLQQPVDIFILELGGNDGLRGISVESTKKNLIEIIEKVRAKYPQVVIILAGMQVPPNLGQDYTKAFLGMFSEIATEKKTALIPFLLEGVGGHPDLNLPDGIHPTAEGHKIVSKTVWKYLEPFIKQRLTNSKK